jgi:hypothetical protein
MSRGALSMYGRDRDKSSLIFDRGVLNFVNAINTLSKE